jgi:NAD(P)-dependent dehydrogenase (short-subunit alcohol dehydrogenase family)
MNEGHAILVTGATGKIGRALVRHFLTKGWTVIATSRSADKLAALASETGESSQRLFGFTVDLAAQGSIHDLATDLAVKRLYPTVLVNNARDIGNLAVGGDGRPTRESWNGEFALGVVAPYELAWTLAHQNGSRLVAIVNIGSMYGIVAANPSLYVDPIRQSPIHYGPVKAALVQLTKELAVRLAPRGIRANAISLGGVEGRTDKEFHERYATLCPLRRMLREDEVAGAVEFLATNTASSMTGHNLVIDGGWTAW